MKEIDVVENVSYTLIYKNGIFILKYTDGIVLTLDIAKEVVEIRKKHSKNVSRPCLINIAGIKEVTEEATSYLLSQEAINGVNALAMIVSTEVEKLLAKFYTSLGTPSIPTKLFDDETNAVRWLYLQKKETKN